MKTKTLAVSDDPSHVLEPDHGKGNLRAKLKSKERKNGNVEPKMDHFDDFQEKDGYESTKPLDVLPNKPRCNDFGDNHDQDEIDFGELQEKLI